MGRQFDSNEELDRPDLNKCPDCGCFFAQDSCPLCGKICPEEMRAGNRKAVKKKRNARGSSGRVTFINWYHQWWFIILMFFVSPLIGLILLGTSPHRTRTKILVAVAVLVVYPLLAALTTFIVTYVMMNNPNVPNLPIDTASMVKYVAQCLRNTDLPSLFRNL